MACALEIVEADDQQRGFVGGVENHLWRLAGEQGLLPAGGTEAPTIAGLQAGKSELRARRRQVVTAGLGEGEEVGGGDTQMV
jgi:hypothetical protein